MSSSRGNNARAYDHLADIVKTFDEKFTIYEVEIRWRETLGIRHIPTSLQIGQMFRRLIASNLIEKVEELEGGRGSNYYPVAAYTTIEPEIAVTNPKCIECDIPMTGDNTRANRKTVRCGKCYLKYSAKKRRNRET
jgi:hypothetical protein